MTNRVDHCGILAHRKHRFFFLLFFPHKIFFTFKWSACWNTCHLQREFNIPQHPGIWTGGPLLYSYCLLEALPLVQVSARESMESKPGSILIDCSGFLNNWHSSLMLDRITTRVWCPAILTLILNAYYSIATIAPTSSTLLLLSEEIWEQNKDEMWQNCAHMYLLTHMHTHTWAPSRHGFGQDVFSWY